MLEGVTSHKVRLVVTVVLFILVIMLVAGLVLPWYSFELKLKSSENPHAPPHNDTTVRVWVHAFYLYGHCWPMWPYNSPDNESCRAAGNPAIPYLGLHTWSSYCHLFNIQGKDCHRGSQLSLLIVSWLVVLVGLVFAYFATMWLWVYRRLIHPNQSIPVLVKHHGTTFVTIICTVMLLIGVLIFLAWPSAMHHDIKHSAICNAKNGPCDTFSGKGHIPLAFKTHELVAQPKRILNPVFHERFVEEAYRYYPTEYTSDTSDTTSDCTTYDTRDECGNLTNPNDPFYVNTYLVRWGPGVGWIISCVSILFAILSVLLVLFMRNWATPGEYETYDYIASDTLA